MPLSQAQKSSLESLASQLDSQVAALVVDADVPTGPTQAELDAAIAERDAALAQVVDLQQKIDTAKAQLRAAADADAAEDAGRAGALSALGD
jgi:hypothetical protein